MLGGAALVLMWCANAKTETAVKQTTDSHSHASVADADTATSSGITINTKLWEGKWTEVTQPPPNSRAWVDDNYNDQVVLTFFKKRPDITAPM
jgi:hypothetical protein